MFSKYKKTSEPAKPAEQSKSNVTEIAAAKPDQAGSPSMRKPSASIAATAAPMDKERKRKERMGEIKRTVSQYNAAVRALQKLTEAVSAAKKVVEMQKNRPTIPSLHASMQAEAGPDLARFPLRIVQNVGDTTAAPTGDDAKVARRELCAEIRRLELELERLDVEGAVGARKALKKQLGFAPNLAIGNADKQGGEEEKEATTTTGSKSISFSDVKVSSV